MTAPRTAPVVQQPLVCFGGPTQGQRIQRAHFAGFGFDPGALLQQGEQAAQNAYTQATQAAQQAEQQAQQRAGQIIQTAQGAIPDPATLIKSIKVDTTHLPGIEVDDPLQPTPDGAGSQMARWLKPRITVAFNPVFGKTINPVTYAPYGDPGTSDWDTWAAVGALAVSAGVAVSLFGLASVLRGHKGGLVHRVFRRKERKAMGLNGVKLKNLSRGTKVLGVYFGVGAAYHAWRWSKTKQLPSLLEFAGWPAVADGVDPTALGAAALAATAVSLGHDVITDGAQGLGGLHLPKTKLGKLGISYFAMGGAAALALEYKRWQRTAAAQAQDAKANAAAGKMVQRTTPYRFDPARFTGEVLAWPVVVAGAGFSY